MELKGKIAVITGGGSGIGRATAQRLAREGAAVVLADVDGAATEATAAEIAQAGGRAVAVRADVSDLADARRMFETAGRHFGGIDILCNNAGITTGSPSFSDASLEQWQRVLDVNLRAVILGTHLAIPLLRQRGGGAIVHTASLAGLIGFPPDPVYAATKAGVVMFTHSMGVLAAEGIRVNCVCPGIVDTPLLRRGRGSGDVVLPPNLPMLQPEDIADGILQLITDDTLAGKALRIAVGVRDIAPLPEFRMPQGR